MLLPILSSLLQFLSFPPVESYYLIFIFLVPLFFFLLYESHIWKITCGIIFYRLISVILIGSYLPEPLFIFFEVLFFVPFIILVIFFKKIHVRLNFFLPIIAIGFLLSECFAARFAPLPSFVGLSGLPIANTPLINIIHLGSNLTSGPYMASFFVVLVNFLFTLIFINIQKNNRNLKEKVKDFIKQISIILMLIISIGLFSNIIFHNQKNKVNTEKKHLRLAIISTGRKYNDGSGLRFPAPKTKEEIKNYIEKGLNEVKNKIDDFHPELIIMPEHFFDLILLDDTNSEAKEKFGITNAGVILTSYQTFAKANNTAILISIKTYSKERGKRQTAMLIDNDGNLSGISDKYYLIIANERWPFGKWLPFYWKWSIPLLPPATREETFITTSPTGQFSPAEKPFSTINFGDIILSPLLCSESHYPFPYESAIKNGTKVFISSSDNVWLPFSSNQYIKETLWLKKLYAVSSKKLIIVSGLMDVAGIIYPDGTFDGVFPKKTDTILLFTSTIDM